MTIQEALKEVETISKVKSKSSIISITFHVSDPDDEIKRQAEERDVTCFEPCSTVPYFWFVKYDSETNINYTIQGQRKKVLIKFK